MGLRNPALVPGALGCSPKQEKLREHDPLGDGLRAEVRLTSKSLSLGKLSPGDVVEMWFARGDVGCCWWLSSCYRWPPRGSQTLVWGAPCAGQAWLTAVTMTAVTTTNRGPPCAP